MGATLMSDITTTDVVITCTPGGGILAVSADTIAALDRLGATLPGQDWCVHVHIDRLGTDPVVLEARPAHNRTETTTP